MAIPVEPPIEISESGTAGGDPLKRWVTPRVIVSEAVRRTSKNFNNSEYTRPTGYKNGPS